MLALQLAREPTLAAQPAHPSSHAQQPRPESSSASSSSAPLLATALLQLLPHLISLTTSQSLQTAAAAASSSVSSTSASSDRTTPFIRADAPEYAITTTIGSAVRSGSEILVYDGSRSMGSRSTALYGSAAAGLACAPTAPLASLAVVCQLLVEIVGKWLSPAEWVPLMRGALQGPLLPGLEGQKKFGPTVEGRPAHVSLFSLVL